MLSSIFNMENKFWMFANKVADMVILEILWLIFCLPIVTIGASSSAFWHVMVCMAKDQEGYICSSFWKVFREKFSLGFKLWGLQMVVTAVFVIDIYFCLKMGTERTMFMVGIFAVLMLFYALFSIWYYPIAGNYKFTWKKVISNSFFLMMSHLPHTLSCLVLFLIAIVFSVYVPYAFIVFPVLACYISAKVMVWVFSKYEQGTV